MLEEKGRVWGKLKKKWNTASGNNGKAKEAFRKLRETTTRKTEEYFWEIWQFARCFLKRGKKVIWEDFKSKRKYEKNINEFETRIKKNWTKRLIK